MAGIALAFAAVHQQLSVSVGEHHVTLVRGGAAQELQRVAVSAVFHDGKNLVVLGRSGDELARERCDLDAAHLQDAFVRHGFPWSAAGDPYKHEYRRWIEDEPDLSASANALLKVRQRALAKGHDEDVAELRTELAKLGIVVREEKKRQYWRRVRGT